MAEATNSKCGSSLCRLSQKFDKEAACTSRLCPSKSKLTEACFHETPIPFAGDSSLTLSNGTKIKLKSNFVVDGTLPAGSQWQTLPIPSTSQLGMEPKGIPGTAFQFEPPCYEPTLPTGLSQGRCSGEWTPNIT